MVLENISSLTRGPSFGAGACCCEPKRLAHTTLSCRKPCAIAFRGSFLPRETCVSFDWRGWLPFRDHAAASLSNARGGTVSLTRPRFRLRIGVEGRFARAIPPHPYGIPPRL